MFSWRFAGGFGQHALQAWGENTIKRYVHEAVNEALKLESALAKLDSAFRPVFQGTLLSRSQYLVDILSWQYRDVRLRPTGTLTREQIAHWTAAIADNG